MLMFVGGGIPPFGKREGIHWHMNINNRVEYIASDDKRLAIPWVKKIAPDGKEEIYVDETSGFTADTPPKGELRRMDCMDCHNRPSHIYQSPNEAVNEALTYGAMDKTLPFIKAESVKALTGTYTSHEEAKVKIKWQLEEFYKNQYPEIWNSRKSSIDRSIDALVEIYRTNFFPQMGVSWQVYPDHIGHKDFLGCFRCHDGRHKTQDGKVLTKDCKSCHNIIEQGPVAGVLEQSAEGLEFKHPEDIGDSWKEMSCSECHTGA